MKNKLIPILVMALIGLSLLLVRRQAMADPATTEPYREVVVDLDTGVHDGGQERDAILVYDELVHVPDAIWLRLHIPDYYLGSGSYLQLTARQDGSQQRLDSISLPNWSNYSAYFNGDSVRVELYVAPEDTGVYARLDRALAGVMIPAGRGAGAPSEPESLCGADDRIASTDQRTGRLSTLTTGPVAFCTAWLISNGSLLTAGHCADSDPDDFGPLLPDGVLDWTANTVVEFNVPASLPNGQVVIAAADHQYPVNLNSVVWAYGGDGGVLGNDWAVFRVNPNTNTGRLPHQIRGFYRVIDLNPGTSGAIRITGYGVDNTPPGTTGRENAQTRTNQTSVGFFEGRTVNGNAVAYRYRVDTTGANSGSPVIWTVFSDIYTVGIHTNAGCEDDGTGSNVGTAFEVTALQTAINNSPGPNRRYVDWAQSYIPFEETGWMFRPFDTVTEGVNSTPNGGTVSIVAGNYNETLTINRPIRLVAPVGDVKIGQ